MLKRAIRKLEAGWASLLLAPLPTEPTYDVVEDARKQVFLYLEWASRDVAQVDPVKAKREIRRAAERLVELAAATPAALAASVNAAKRFQAGIDAQQKRRR